MSDLRYDLMTAVTPLALLGRAERRGLVRLARPVSEWLAARTLPPASARAVGRIAASRGLATVSAVLGDPAVWNALGGRVGRVVLDDLTQWILLEVPVPEAPAPAVAPRSGAVPTIRLDMPEAELHAWAAAQGIEADLAVGTRVLEDRVDGRARYWFWQSSGSTVGELVGAGASRRRDAVPYEVRAAAVGWLEGRARRALVLRDEAAALAALPAPEEPLLRALWDRVVAARARADVRPALAAECKNVRYDIVEDPPLFCARDGWPALCRGGSGALAHIAPQAPTEAAFLNCTCGEPLRCAFAVATLDALRRVIATPGAPERRALLAALMVPSWERALSDMDALLAGAPAPAPVLGWRVDLDVPTLVPLRCEPRKRGDGWKVAKMTLPDLRAHPLVDCLPADAVLREVVLAEGAARGAQSVYPLLPRLEGHPRVFVGTTPVAVRRGVVEVDWTQEDDGSIVLTPLVGGRRQPADVLAVRVAGFVSNGWSALYEDGVIYAFPVDASVRALTSLLATRGARFPPEARAPLLARLTPLSRVAPARLAPALRGEERPPDTRLVVRLDPLAEGGLLVAALVRPLPGAPAFPPGEGPGELHAEDDGRRFHVARDLAAEPAAARAALADLGLRPDAEDPAFTWTLLELDDALDLVSAVRERADLVVEWTDPSRRRRTRNVSAKDLSLRLRSSRDWFDLDGSVNVDGASVALGAVLAAVLAGKRYVAVGNDTWARLDAELAERLAAVADVAETTTKGVGVSPLAAPLVEGLREAGAALDAPKGWEERVSRAREAATWEPPFPEGFTASLRDYQLAGYTWLARLARWAPGACLADDMGLGKTVQALALLALRASEGPALVVAPTSVGFNWLREAARFAPGLRVRAYRGAGRAALLEDLRPGDVLVTSWDLLPRDIDALVDVKFGTLVLDEAQAAKNAATARAKAAARLDAGFRVALTGTPVENRVSELWSLFRVAAPGLLGSWERFRTRFAVPIERDGDSRRQAALARTIRPFLLRRLKSEVARELPPRTDIRVEVVLSREERNLYDAARAALATQIADAEGPPEQQRFKVLAALTRLRQLACHPRLLDPTSVIPSAKLARLRELVAELRDEGHRALVFSQFTSHLALVRAALEADGVRLRYLDGSTPEAARRAEVDAFQAGQGEVFLISLKAGGTGLTLTGASYVIHLDPWWNPAVEDQASDRAHRIGQTQPVTVYRLVARGTIEDKILALHDEKRALVAGLLDGSGAAAAMGTDELVALLQAGDDVDVDEDVEPAVVERVAAVVAPVVVESVVAPVVVAEAAVVVVVEPVVAEPAQVLADDVPPNEVLADDVPPNEVLADDVPPAASAAPFDLWAALADLQAQFDALTAAGGMRDPTRRSYLRILGRFGLWARRRPGPLDTVADLDAAAAEWLAGVAAGTIDAPASDAVVGRTPLKKLREIATR